MNVKEFKEYLNQFDNELPIGDIFKLWLFSFANESEVVTISRASYDTINYLRVTHKGRNETLERQLNQTKMYLKGEMYKDEETAKEMLYKQIDNIERVLGK